MAAGYQVIGPVVEDGAIVLRELSSTAELPFGWGVRLEPDGYRLRRRDDTAASFNVASPALASARRKLAQERVG